MEQRINLSNEWYSGNLKDTEGSLPSSFPFNTLVAFSFADFNWS